MILLMRRPGRYDMLHGVRAWAPRGVLGMAGEEIPFLCLCPEWPDLGQGSCKTWRELVCWGNDKVHAGRWSR